VHCPPLRWLVQHCGHLPPRHAAIASRRDLGLSFLPVEACYKQAAKLRDDKELAADLMSLRRLLDAGLPISIASDNIPSSLFFAIWCCLARRDYRGQVLPDPDGPISRDDSAKMRGGGRGRSRTSLRSQFPASSEKNRDFLILGLFSAHRRLLPQ
jgi:hypothetical protein